MSATELQDATRDLLVWERRRYSAVGQSEVLEATSGLAKASLTVQQTEAKLQQARRSLGQACLESEFAPPVLQDLYSEIQRLRNV